MVSLEYNSKKESSWLPWPCIMTVQSPKMFTVERAKTMPPPKSVPYKVIHMDGSTPVIQARSNVDRLGKSRTETPTPPDRTKQAWSRLKATEDLVPHKRSPSRLVLLLESPW